MKLWRQMGVLGLLVSLAAAQATPGRATEVKDLQVKQQGGDVRVEVRLSSGVRPSIETAVNPDRLVLILPGTIADARQKRIAVHASGVRAVRMGLYSADPPVTRVVVDLDTALPYTLSTRGDTVILRVQSPAAAKRRTGAPAPAASASVLGSVFNRPKPLPQPDASTTAGASAIPVPPSLPPLQSPASQSQPASSTRSAPSAAHPNFGSLQQGVVNPGMGSPGTGTVPPVAGAQIGTLDAGFDQTAAKSSNPAISQAATVGTFANSGQPGSSEAANPAASAQVAAVPVPAPPAATSPVQPAHPTAPGTNTTTPNSAALPPTSSAGFTSIPPQGSTASVPENQPSSIHSDSSGSTGQAVEAADGDSAKSGVPKDAVIPELAARANPDFRIAFRVKYVASGAAYLDGGRAAGLAEGMKLVVRDTPGGVIATPATTPANQLVVRGTPENKSGSPESAAPSSPEPADPTIVAELEVISVAETSAVTDIHDPKRDVKAGDLAYLSSAEQDALVQKSALSSTRKYPTVVAFTEGDTLDDEVRAEVPRPPMPSVNRARGRIGLDYLGTISHGSGGGTSSDLGLVTRIDMTRIGATYWTASGYWRGRLSSSSYTGQQTIQDLINRTYHLSLTYDNPNSPWVAGFGRMYLPWATSLDTIDGGYFGRRLGHGATLGVFLGSTPDPTSYSYNPDQEITGSFINFEGGSFDHFKYTSTSGAGVSMLSWAVQNPFIFFENGLYYKRVFSLYDAVQFDSPTGNQAVSAPGFGMGRNFLTARYMPHPRIEFNASYNYFRDLPTFDPTLIGTGLLDKFLFQGLSGGVRVAVLKQVWLYTDIGKSDRTGDPTSSLNQLYGITFDRIPWVKLRADAHYSKFDSSFGSGNYEAVSLTRSLNDSMFLQLLAGDQTFASQYTSNTQSKFLTTNLDFNIGMHYFLQGGFTISRGATMDYDQYMFTLGYRFDTKRFKAQ
jgi:AMIN domain